MIYWNPDSDTLPPRLKRCAVSIGNFDGVHLGHAEIIRRLKAHGGPALVFTFAQHPKSILHPEKAPNLLTLPERKAELLRNLGVDEVIFAQTEEILNWPADYFFERVVVNFLDARILAEGANFLFGKGRTGDTRTLAEFCRESGRELEVVRNLHEVKGDAVSSSRIRRCIAQGELAEANALLTAPYQMAGKVVHGEARGRTMGFPTANLDEIQTILPAHGVYACRAILPDGERRPAAVHIGPNVTFHETRTKVEVHLLDFQGNVYGLPLKIDFHSRLRELVPFSGREALMAQIELDIRETRARITAWDR